MLDAKVRTYIDPPLNFLGGFLIRFGLTANKLTLIGFSFGLGAIFSVSSQYYALGAIFFLINRFMDGLDGALARKTKLTVFGGILDIVCDFIIYAGMIFGFCLSMPESIFWGTFLIFSFIGPMSSFLAYAIFAEKMKKETTRRGVKSFYYMGGLCEGTETASIILFLCLFPFYFEIVCLVFGSLCWLTTLGRLYQAYFDFHDSIKPL